MGWYLSTLTPCGESYRTTRCGTTEEEDNTPDDAFDNIDRTTPEPDEPPNPNPGNPDSPVPGPAHAPVDPGLRQNDPPGPPRTRATARVPGQELPASPGIAHDRLPLEHVLKKLKKVVTPSDK